MIGMRVVIIGLVGALVAGCGGVAKHVACVGATCLKVAGDYQAVLKTDKGLNTCQSITYDGSAPGTSATIAAPFTIVQDPANGSVVTFTFRGADFRFEVKGTLFQDGSASFQERIPHVTVIDRSSGTTLDYADSTMVQLNFIPAGTGFQISGSLRDSLTANQSVPTDTSCTLSAQLTGSR
jgi:hypothetical protein